MNVHVVTAVTRPENLDQIARSLNVAARQVGSLLEQLSWHVRIDHNHQHVGGQAVKNIIIHTINDPYAWVYVLDDDTICHPNLFRVLARTGTRYAAVVGAQERGGETVVIGGPREVEVNLIDIGQVAFQRRSIGEMRIPETYNGDGLFLVDFLHNRMPVLYVEETISYYNKLRGGY